MSGRMLFIGASTAGSRSFELFPRWSAILGLDATLEGHDLALGAPPQGFRAAVEQIAEDPTVAGALVTAHKVDIYRHARALFDELDPNARLCREVSCISKRGAALVGHAKDPITAGRTLSELLPPDPWTDGAQALCLGAGGAGTAIAVCLAGGDRPPASLVVTDTAGERLETLGAVLDELRPQCEVALEAAEENDAVIERLPPGSLVINATGLGKDAPGSPLSDEAVFPERGIVWELNYRGELRFLDQARRQRDARGLELHDGWRYFVHGWIEVIAEVFHVQVTPAQFARLADAAR